MLCDDDISELAELLDTVCQEFITNGGLIGNEPGFCCPMAVLFNVSGHPSAADIVELSHREISYPEALAFVNGFDDNAFGNVIPKSPMFALGVQLREKYSI